MLKFPFNFFKSDCQIQSHNVNGTKNGEFDFSAQKQIKSNSEQQESNSTSSNEEDVDPKRYFLNSILFVTPSNLPKKSNVDNDCYSKKIGVILKLLTVIMFYLGETIYFKKAGGKTMNSMCSVYQV